MCGGHTGFQVNPDEDAHIMAVAGGTGLAAVYQVARDFGNAEIFAGARSANRLYYLDECRQIADVHVATDDGSEGFHGVVTDLLRTNWRLCHPKHARRSCSIIVGRHLWSARPLPLSASFAVQNRYSARLTI